MSRVRYTRLYSDADGESHFEDLELPLESADFAPPAAPLLLSPALPATQLAFLNCPDGWIGEWHPVPRRQWMLWLSGYTDIEATNGEVRHVGPGDILLVEDTTGRGHRSWQAGDEPFLIAVARIE